ncbi:MAG: restriction modification system specificity subunit [Streptosporangiaceae bacterium]|nr:restriction modification system specificity subunit [Streptosporangiaceae bacterium]
MRPYLRVANVFEDEIRLGDLKEMDFPPDIFAKFALRSGDILLNEGQSPEYLGRPAMYRGEPGRFAFTNSLLRFRAGPEVLPEWALLVFRRHLHAGRFVKEVRITTNIAHLSAARFKSIEFPVPPIEVQAEIVKRTQETLDMITRMVSGVHAAARRGERLRQAVLADAFAGRLVPQDPTDEPASVLLERIRTERAAASKPTRTRRGPRPDPAQEALS